MQKICLGVLAMAVLAGAQSVRADKIAAAGSVNVGNPGSVPAPGNDGYVYYGFIPTGGSSETLSKLPGYVSGIQEQGTSYTNTSGPDTTLTVDGLTGVTGVDYDGPSNTVESLATITLGSGVPSSFQIGLLGTNGVNPSNATTYTVASSAGGSLTIAANSAVQENIFDLLTVTGAAAGETITISGEASNHPVLGGITFDPVPEPATLGLLCVGGLALLRRRRA